MYFSKIPSDSNLFNSFSTKVTHLKGAVRARINTGFAFSFKVNLACTPLILSQFEF